ncbi:hypothetical protein JYQ62_32220 [Nostoc sp. UHCC 0702]|nr:hypothetical protein JYQ62_32220 [Nostoc sp. UHCC 0702]
MWHFFDSFSSESAVSSLAGDWVLGTGDWVLGTGYWGLGTGDWVLGTGDWGMGLVILPCSPSPLLPNCY